MKAENNNVYTKMNGDGRIAKRMRHNIRAKEEENGDDDDEKDASES